MRVEVGPDFDEAGDPDWIRPLEDGDAREGDRYITSGRHRERIFPPTNHPVNENPGPLLRLGYGNALRRWNAAVEAIPETLEAEQKTSGFYAVNSPTAQILAVAHDFLEWIHAFDDYLRVKVGTYNGRPTPADVDPVRGPIVDGLLGARIALHHNAAQVIGLVRVAPAIYVGTDRVWQHTGTFEQPGTLQPRWMETIPPQDQMRRRQAFLDHLAGLPVGHAFGIATQYFWLATGDDSAPEVRIGSTDHPPGFAPTGDEGAEARN